MKISPCKTCTDRQIGCHGQCDRYKEWKAEKDEEKATRYRCESIDRDFASIYAKRTKAGVRKHKKGHRV